MKERNQPLSGLHSELVRQILTDASSQIGPALQTALGHPPENLEVRTSMVPSCELNAMFGSELHATVKIGFEGDIHGMFLLLQRHSGYEALRTVFQSLFSRASDAGHDAASYMRRDWVLTSQADGAVSDGRVRDTLNELGNALLGVYLTYIYRKCHLATFQEMSEVEAPDLNQALLRAAVDCHGGVSQKVFAAEVSCFVNPSQLQFWLVMLAEPDAFRAMLENLNRQPP